MANLEALQETLGYNFSDTSLLETALTHASTQTNKNYERLEFLGDRVLGLVIADIIFKTFPEETEGDLAKRNAALVQGKTLASIAKEIELGAFMILSDAERSAGGTDNKNILADVIEGVLGALYIDGGIDVCEKVIKKLWGNKIHHMSEPPQDPKTELQEWAQGRGLPLPEYELVEQSGPDHAPLFNIKVTVHGFPPKSSEGPSRRKAEKLAATLLLEELNSKKD
jgi:ribonuclease-3